MIIKESRIKHMKNINMKYYENFNKSKYKIRRVVKPENCYYKLSLSSYLIVEFKDLSYSKYLRLDTLNDKVSFLITLMCNFMQNKKILNGETDFEILTQKEFNENEEIKELFNMLENKIPKCKGIRMKRNSFKNEYCNYFCDNSHTKRICSLYEFLELHQITLDEFLFNPFIIVEVNTDIYINY